MVPALQTVGPRHSLDLGMHYKFTWLETIADVSKPFLGTEFHCQSNLLVDAPCEGLLDGQTFYGT